jgi:hypothetical protein
MACTVNIGHPRKPRSSEFKSPLAHREPAGRRGCGGPARGRLLADVQAPRGRDDFGFTAAPPAQDGPTVTALAAGSATVLAGVRPATRRVDPRRWCRHRAHSRCLSGPSGADRVVDRVTALRGKGRAREPSICMFGRLGWTASTVAPEGSFWAVADYLGSTLAASGCERLPGPIAVADSAPRPGGSPGGSYGRAPPAHPLQRT